MAITDTGDGRTRQNNESFRQISRNISENLRPIRLNPRTRCSSPSARPAPGESNAGSGETEARDRIMMFLLRTAFWATVALALVPSFAPKQASTVPVV